MEIDDVIIKAEDTKQKPTAKNKAKYKTITFKNRWISQKFLVVNDEEIRINNQYIEELISSVSTWEPTTVGSNIGAQTAQYAIFSAEQLNTLIKSIYTAFDREPFNKPKLIEIVGQAEVPVILMWTNKETKTRYRTIYPDDSQDRIKVLQQGADNSNLEKAKYLGDKKVVVDLEKINIQIHYVSPGLSKGNRLEKDQYMFSIYMPKDKKYFIKDND